MYKKSIKKSKLNKTYLFIINSVKIINKLCDCCSPGPSHKITYSILKEKLPDYASIIWRDG